MLLETSDDGQGFEPAKTPKGMGLTNMQERAKRLNGTFEIASQPKEGTTVTVRIPFSDGIDDANDEANAGTE